MIIKILGIAFASLYVMAGAMIAQADGPQIDRGRTLAQVNCARCHAIGAAGESRSQPFGANLHGI